MCIERSSEQITLGATKDSISDTSSLEKVFGVKLGPWKRNEIITGMLQFTPPFAHHNDQPFYNQQLTAVSLKHTGLLWSRVCSDQRRFQIARALRQALSDMPIQCDTT